MADICHLQNKNIQGRFIIFQRRKTINKYKASPKYIKVSITDSIQATINKWGNQNSAPDEYLFPLLNHSLTAYELKKSPIT